MKMKIIYNLFILFLIFAFNNAYALDKKLFIDKILQNSNLFEEQEIDLEIKKIDFIGHYKEYNDIKLEVDAKVDFLWYLQNKDSNYIYTNKRHKQSKYVEIALNKNFFKNGSELEISLNKDVLNSNEIDYKEQQYYREKEPFESESELRIVWKLPLISNVGGILDKRYYDLAQLEFLDQLLIFEDFKNNTIGNYLKLYYEFSYTLEKIKLLKEKINQIKNIVIYAKSQESSNKEIDYIENILVKLNTKMTALIADKIKLSKNLEAVLDAKDINDIKADLYYIAEFDVKEKDKQKVIQIKRIGIELLKNIRNIIYYKNSLKPELNLSFDFVKNIKNGNFSSYSTSNTNYFEISLDFQHHLGGNIESRRILQKYILKTRKIYIKYNKTILELENNEKLLKLKIENKIKNINKIKKELTNKDNALLTISQEFKKDRANLLYKKLALELEYLDELFDYKVYLINFDYLF